MKKIQNALIGYGAIAIVAALIGFLICSSNSRKSDACPDGQVCLPTNKLDVMATVTGTTVGFAYPSAGLFATGAEVTQRKDFKDESVAEAGMDPNKQILGSFQLNTPSTPPVAETGVGYFGMMVEVQKKSNETLDQLVQRLQSPSNPRDYEREYSQKGALMGVSNDHQFFIYHITEDRDAWIAVSVGKEYIVRVTLGGKPMDNPAGRLAYASEYQLLLEILKKISFE